jgi:hypothetical protein
LAGAAVEKCRRIPAVECSEMPITRKKAQTTIKKTMITKARQVLLADLYALLIY